MAYTPESYADLHVFGASITITIGAQNTFVAIPSSLLSSDSLGFTLSGGNTQTCNDGGVYAITLHCTVQCASSNQLVSLTYGLNGAASSNVEGQSELVNASKPYCISCSDIQTLAKNDAITIMLAN